MNLKLKRVYSYMVAHKILSFFLNALSKEINALSENDLKKLETGQYSLRLKVVKNQSSSDKANELSDSKAYQILNELKRCTNREDGYQILSVHFKIKKELEEFARKIDVFLLKQDTVSKIKDKIIEGVVGASLRSSVVQGSSKEQTYIFNQKKGTK